MTITIQPIRAFKDNYIWALIDNEHQHVCVVDPGDAAPVLSFLAQTQLTLIGVLITHHHFDHYDGAEKLAEKFHMPIYGAVHEKNPAINHPVTDHDEVVLFGNLKFKVMTIPGHTLEHIAYYCAEQQLLFCGDTLFAAGCGRLFEGTPAQMYASLMRIKGLPDNTQIYCGHEYTLANLKFAYAVEPKNTAILERIQQVEKLRQEDLPTLPSQLSLEKLTNPFLRCELPDVIAAAEKHCGQELHDAIAVFAVIRQWKNNFV